MKRYLGLFLVFMLCLTLCACSENSLSGKYVSDPAYITVEFKRDGSCTWYEDNTLFNGTYQKVDGGWQLNIIGDGFYDNTVFRAEGNGKALVITGGTVYRLTFTKK